MPNISSDHITRGTRFFHAQWLDASKMPAKEPLLCQVTRVRRGAIYYRPVYNYGDREGLGSPMWETRENFPTRVLRFAP